MKDGTRLSLKYYGPAVDEGRLNVYEAASTMLAFSDFVTRAGKVVFGSEVEMRAEVEGFRQGSFLTSIMFQFVGPAIPLMAMNADVSDWLRTIRTAFDLWKFLKGSPPKEVSSVNKSHDVTVTNNDGKVMIVNIAALNLVMDDKATEAVERFVGAQLNMEDLKGVEVLHGKKKLAAATRSEAGYFRSVSATLPMTDNTFEYALSIEAPVFKDGNKWRFSDGGSSFFADIEDEDFIQRVNTGESFAKGDALRVRMRIEQGRKGSDLTTTRTIIKVLEHIRQQSSGRLPF